MRGWKKILGKLGLEDAIQMISQQLKVEQKRGHCAPGRGKTECSCLASALDLDGSILAVAKTVFDFSRDSKQEQQTIIINIIQSAEKRERSTEQRLAEDRLVYPLLSIGTWQAPVDSSKERIDVKICKAAVVAIFLIGDTYWKTCQKLVDGEKEPSPHGNCGRGGACKKQKLDETVGPELKAFWMRECDAKLTTRKLFQQFCWEQGYDVVWGKNSPVTSKREDEEWLGRKQDRGKICCWSTFAQRLKAYAKEFVPEWEETRSLLREEYGTKESIVTYSQQLDVEYKQMHHFEEKVNVLQEWTLLKSVYEKYMPEDDEGCYHYKRWKQGLVKLEEEVSLNPNKAPVQREPDFWTGKEQPPLPEVWPRGYTFDCKSSVLIVDFNRLSTNPIDGFPNLFLQCLERDDIAVVSEGLVKVDPKLWTLDYLCTNFRAHYHHSYKRFTTKDGSTIEMENDGMTFDKYKECLDNDQKIYMTDFNLELLPRLKDDFDRAMEPFPSLMHGGPHCLMKHTPYNCRRNFGPNLYITPPGTFTQIHQDGCGTVDSGHYCHRGYNEVIMLKRGTEKEMKEAEEILVGKSVYDSTEPHFEGKKPGWPTRTAIEECETKLGLVPILLLLKPGQFLHIPKGCSHMFRKASGNVNELQELDCHRPIRCQFQDAIKNEDNAEGLCVSIAFDWVFSGHTKEGIQRETMWSLMTIIRNRRNTGANLCKEKTPLRLAKTVQSLAQTELALLCLADQLSSQKPQFLALAPIIISVIRRQLAIIDYAEATAAAQIEVAAAKEAKKLKDPLGGLVGLITMEKNVPDTKHSSSTLGVIDAYTPDFECGYCQLELANCYFHCNACSRFTADFMICASCHQAGYYRLSRDLGRNVTKEYHCSSGGGGFLHTQFSFRQRFWTKDDLSQMKARMEVVDISLDVSN